jgi:hypothetical protein
VEGYILIGSDKFVKADASLYRPSTKDGDPRVWFSRLGSYAAQGDILAICAQNGRLFVLNITTLDLAEIDSFGGGFSIFLAPFFAGKTSVVDELVGALMAISNRGFIHSVGSADTTVGMLLESELGIRANSSKAPDYKGIEIKAARADRMNRHNLFAKVPNWAKSTLKSSQNILDRFGYQKDGRQQLYCTVAADRPNPQGLFLSVDQKGENLWEKSVFDDVPFVAVWPVEELRSSLLAKHSETFWVGASSRRTSTGEEFHFTTVEYTSNPIVEQLIPLVNSRHVTMDHLVREKNGRAAERGPLFKLKHGSLGRLFPPSVSYDLGTGRVLNSP